MRPLTFLTLVLFTACGHLDYTNPEKTVSPDEIDIRSYYAFNKMVDQERIYCYNRIGKEGHAYRLFTITEGNRFNGERYNDSLVKVNGWKMELASDHLTYHVAELYDYSERPAKKITMSCESSFPYKFNLKNNHFSFTWNAKDLGLQFKQNYFYSKLEDTTAAGIYHLDDCIKCNIVFTEPYPGLYGQVLETKDFEIFAKGVGCIYFTESGGFRKYRLDKIIDGPEFARLQGEFKHRRPESLQPVPVAR